MDLHFWQESQQIYAHKKTLGSCNRYERRFCAKEEEGVSIVKGRERRGVRVHIGTIEERVH